ncbi:MAG: stage II sporulation protein P, partial [Bacillota bacterium]
YYYIYAEEDGRELMRVPIAVSIDDELITEDNKRYRIVRVEENRGIARFVENVNIEQYKTK